MRFGTIGMTSDLRFTGHGFAIWAGTTVQWP